jgi:dihydroorotase
MSKAFIYCLRKCKKSASSCLSTKEVTDVAVDIFDRETCFVKQVMEPISLHIPELKIVFEHITTKAAVHVRICFSADPQTQYSSGRAV